MEWRKAKKSYWKPSHAKTKPVKKVTFTGVLADLLFTLAFVLSLYIIWQLWWTTFMVQDGIKDAITTFQSENPTIESDAEPTHRTDAPPQVGDVAYGEIYGVLHVMEWNWMQIPIAQGTGSDVLDLGYAGHYETTQQAGEIGNFAVAAHRRTYGNNFRRIDTLTEGDQVVVETASAYLVYEVIGYEIVDPTTSEVLLPVPRDATATPTERLMTMTTCHPEYGNSERYIVYSTMVYWTDKSEGKPELLKDEPAIGGEFTTDEASSGYEGQLQEAALDPRAWARAV